MTRLTARLTRHSGWGDNLKKIRSLPGIEESDYMFNSLSCH